MTRARERKTIKRWYGYAAAQGIALATWGVAYLGADTRLEPVPGSWAFLYLGLVLSLIPVVPLALIFGVIDGVVAAPGTVERRLAAYAMLTLFAFLAVAAARYLMDFGNVSPPDQIRSTSGKWVGVLIGLEIGLGLEMLVGLGVSAVLGPAFAPRRRGQSCDNDDAGRS